MATCLSTFVFNFSFSFDKLAKSSEIKLLFQPVEAANKEDEIRPIQHNKPEIRV